jgi:MGT family glycosyltransferase
MAKIGLLTLGVPGHWNPASCLAHTLQSKGHAVTAFQLTYYEELVRRSGVDYCPIGEQVYPRSRMEQIYAHLGTLQGGALLRYTISIFTERSQMYLVEAPELLRLAGIELVLVDQFEPAGACVAEKLGIPFVTLSNALVAGEETSIPPLFTTWPYSTNFAAKVRNQMAYRLVARLTRPWLDSLNAKRREWKLREYRTLWDASSRTAQLSQQPACFDFPRLQLHPQFHYTGPWHDRRVRPDVPFPYEKLTGRRLIYASMGTLQNRVREVFREIAEACSGIDAQLVISLGDGSSPDQLGPLPGNPIVVQMAPQLELLDRASLVITHAGLNTVLESLSCGVPMVAIPVGNDQPGVAARLKWLGAGEFLLLKQLQAAKLRPLLNKVLDEPQYRQRAQEVKTEIQKADGVRRAVELIEGVLN